MIVISVGDDIYRLFLIKIPNRLSRDFKNRGDLLQNIIINLFLLLKERDFLLVPVFAKLKCQCLLLHSHHFPEPLQVTSFVDLPIGGSMCHVERMFG